MGMFDYVNCEYDLPKYKHLKKDDFQTKDLGQNLYKFRITKGGQLVYKEEIDKESDPERVSDHTGWIEFYNYVYRDNDEIIYFRFKAEFFRGNLEAIEDKSVVKIKGSDQRVTPPLT